MSPYVLNIACLHVCVCTHTQPNQWHWTKETEFDSDIEQFGLLHRGSGLTFGLSFLFCLCVLFLFCNYFVGIFVVFQFVFIFFCHHQLFLFVLVELHLQGLPISWFVLVFIYLEFSQTIFVKFCQKCLFNFLFYFSSYWIRSKL